MSFIFRAYHAMARQRPMSTKTGLPTAAIYVFVNMLRKLRDDFSPEYLAAVFDVAGPTFRDEQAEAVTRFASSTSRRRPSPKWSTRATRRIARPCRKIWCSRFPNSAGARGLPHSDS